MQFPYQFNCKYSHKQRGSSNIITCKIYPLTLTIKSDNKFEKQYKNYQLKLKTKEYRLGLTHVLMSKQDYIFLRFSDNTQFKIVEKILENIIPAGQFGEFFKKEYLVDELMNENFSIYASEQKKTKMPYLVKNIDTSNPAQLKELQILLQVNNRCTCKIQKILTEHLNCLKLIYKNFVGNYLKKLIKKKKNIQQQQIKQFTKKLLFFLQSIQNHQIHLQSFTQSTIFLVNNKFSSPLVIDFTSASILPSQSTSNFTSHLKKLGILLYKILFFKVPDDQDIQRLKRWLNQQIQPYNDYLKSYKKSCFQLILILLTNQKIKPLTVFHNKWFHEVKQNGESKLQTIMSIEQQRTLPRISLDFDDDQQQSTAQQYRQQISLSDKMEKHLKQIKIPFKFEKY